MTEEEFLPVTGRWKNYEEDAVYTYLCEHPLDDEISEITNGAYLPVFIKECIIDVELQGVKTDLTASWVWIFSAIHQ